MLNLLSLMDGLCDFAALFIGDRVHRKAYLYSLFVSGTGIASKLFFGGENGGENRTRDVDASNLALSTRNRCRRFAQTLKTNKAKFGIANLVANTLSSNRDAGFV